MDRFHPYPHPPQFDNESNLKDYVHHSSPHLMGEPWGVLQTPASHTWGRSTISNSELRHPDIDGMTLVDQPPAQASGPVDTVEIDLYLQQAERRAQQLVELHEATSKFSKNYRKLSSLREKVLLMRSRTKFSWNSIQQYRRFVTSAQSNFLEEASSLSNTDRLKTLYDQVLIDHDEQSTLENRWAELETQLSNTEFFMQQKEDHLKILVDNMLQLLNDINLPGHGASTATDEPESQRHSIAASSAEPHPLLQHYFDKAGDVALLRDRLADLQLEEDETRATREIQAEQEIKLDLSDADFEALFSHRRTQLLEAFSEAVRIAEDAKKVCLNDGLDLNSWNARQATESIQNHPDIDRLSHQPGSPSSEHGHITAPVETAGQASAPSLSNNQPFPSTEGTVSSVEDRVNAWVEGQADAGPQLEAFVKRTLSMSSLSSPAHSIRGRVAELVARKRERDRPAKEQGSKSEERLRLKTSSSDSRLGERSREFDGFPHRMEKANDTKANNPHDGQITELYG